MKSQMHKPKNADLPKGKDARLEPLTRKPHMHAHAFPRAQKWASRQRERERTSRRSRVK